MEIKANVGLHNKFVIEVRDAETGELKQTATSYNIILDQMYTRLCGGSTYFVNIHFGTGTGTLSPSRTSLFTHLGTKVAVDEELVRSVPNSSWTRRIVINPEEFVGSTFREVGIAFGATATNLVTHSLLRDSEGAPLAITKTATDVLTIYATVYVVLDTQAGNTLYVGREGSSNLLINYLIGGGSFPTGAFEISEAPMIHDSLKQVSPNISWTSDVARKQRKSNVVRFGTTVANGHAQYLQMRDVFACKLPIPGVYGGTSYSGVILGTGDGVNKRFNILSRYVRSGSLTPRLNGVVEAAYSLNLENSQLIPGTFHHLNFGSFISYTSFRYGSNDPNRLITVGSSGTPIIEYTLDPVDTTKALARNWNSPVNSNADCSISRDGNFVAFSSTASPHAVVMERVNGGLTQKGTLSALTNAARGIALHPDDLFVVVSRDTSPFLRCYKWEGDAWVVVNNPSTVPSVAVRSIRFNDAGDLLFIRTGSNVLVYGYLQGVLTLQHTINVGTEHSNTNSFSGDVFSIAKSVPVFAVAIGASPWLAIYKLVGGSWISQDVPTIFTQALTHVSLSFDATALIARIFTTNLAFIMRDGVWTSVNASAFDNSSFLGVFHPRGFGFARHSLSGSWGGFGFAPIVQNLVIVFNTPPAAGVVVTADYTVDGIHKTNQYVVDASFAIQFGEIV